MNETNEDEGFIYINDNFLDSPQVISEIISLKDASKYSTNLERWQDNLKPEGVGLVKIWDIDDPILGEYLLQRMSLAFPNLSQSKYEFAFQLFEWNRDSFIPWHDDGIHSCAMTCYLESNCDHGGELMAKIYVDTTTGYFIEPIPNRAVLLRKVKHCVSKIHKGTRTTLQAWGSTKNANI